MARTGPGVIHLQQMLPAGLGAAGRNRPAGTSGGLAHVERQGQEECAAPDRIGDRPSRVSAGAGVEGGTRGDTDELHLVPCVGPEFGEGLKPNVEPGEATIHGNPARVAGARAVPRAGAVVRGDSPGCFAAARVLDAGRRGRHGQEREHRQEPDPARCPVGDRHPRTVAREAGARSHLLGPGRKAGASLRQWGS